MGSDHELKRIAEVPKSHGLAPITLKGQPEVSNHTVLPRALHRLQDAVQRGLTPPGADRYRIKINGWPPDCRQSFN